MPEISVIIPVFNVDKFLPRCLDSLLAQTFSDFELICINDGSTDACQDILEDYARRDSRIRVVSQANQGVSEARNYGLKLASAPYITFVDADDCAHPQMLSCLYSTLRQTNADIANCLLVKSNSCDTPPWQPIQEGTLSVCKFTDPLGAFMKERRIRTGPYARLYKRAVLDGIYFEPHVRYEDVPFTTQVMCRAKLLVLIKEPLYLYFQHPESFMHQTFTRDKALDYIKIIRITYDFAVAQCPERLSEIRRCILNNRFKMAVNQLMRKQKNKTEQMDIFHLLQKAVKELYAEKIISYSGLKFKHKVRLFLLLHCQNAEFCRLWANLI